METAIQALALVVLGLLFIWAARARPLRPLQIMSLAVGWLALAAALSNPLDELAETSVSAHMLQHEILILIAAPLLALGRAHHLDRKSTRLNSSHVEISYAVFCLKKKKKKQKTLA